MTAPTPSPVTDEMIERGARGMCAEFFERDTFYDHPRVKEQREKALEDARACLTAALDGMAVVQGWRTIDSAPKDGRMILLHNAAHDIQMVLGWTHGLHDEIWPDGCWTDAGSKNRVVNTTINGNFFQSWQPLPSAPKVQGG